MKRLLAALLCLLTLAACRERPAPASPQQPVVKPSGYEPPLENDNLLNLVFGAAVVDRNHEYSYETSAAQAIDGSTLTHWLAAPAGREGVLTMALAAPTRLRRLGATISRDPAPKHLRIDGSLDGQTWRMIVDKELRPVSEPQLFDVDSVDALYLRFTFTHSTADRSAVPSLNANGEEIAPYVQPPLEGCWEINSVPARFTRSGVRVTGLIGDSILVDGGTDGRVYRLMWREGAMWGFAALTVTPDGNRVSGVRWHEEVNPFHTGDGWLGRRVPCASDDALDDVRIADSIAGRAGSWRLYGVRFDRAGKLVNADSESALTVLTTILRRHATHRFRIVARDMRPARASAMLEATRFELTRRGADLNRIEFATAPLHRDFTTRLVMESGVELQVVSPVT